MRQPPRDTGPTPRRWSQSRAPRPCIRLTHPDREKLAALAALVELSLAGAVSFSAPTFGKYNEWRCYAYLPDDWDVGTPVDEGGGTRAT